MKKGKIIALIAALVIVVAGGTVGVLFAAGVFKNDAQKVLELLSQTPEKCSTALIEEIGFGEMITNMNEKGAQYAIGVKEETSGVGVDLSLKGEANGDGRLDAKVDLGGKEINGNIYLDNAGSKISLMLPEMIKDTSFVIDLAKILEENVDADMEETSESAEKCMTALETLYEDEIDVLLDGMECESIKDGYEVTLSEDTMDECLELLAERMQSDEINGFYRDIYSYDEAMLEQWDNAIEQLDTLVEQAKEYTEDYTFEVYCDGSDLTGFQFPITEEGAIEAEFTGDAEDRESEISVTNGEEKVSLTLQSEMSDKQGSSEINAIDNTGTTVFTYKEEYDVESGDLKLEMTAEDETVTLEGEVSELETGEKVTLSIDKVTSSDSAITMPVTVTISMGVLEEDIEALDAENEEVIENSADLTSIVTKYATQLQEFVTNYESELEAFGNIFSGSGLYGTYETAPDAESDLTEYDYLEDSTEATSW